MTSVLRSLSESVSKIYIGYHATNFVFIKCIYCVNCMAHWQLIVLCPTNYQVVWFCSMCKRPDVHIKTAINKLSNIFEVVQHFFGWKHTLSPYICVNYI